MLYSDTNCSWGDNQVGVAADNIKTHSIHFYTLSMVTIPYHTFLKFNKL